MKKILVLIFLFSAVLYGAVMGQKDNISKSWKIRNDHWSCSFIEGSMFPGDFVFADGSRAGAILFRDTAFFDKQEFALFEERHAKYDIVKNTADEFIIEACGTYWRNVSPLIKRIDGLNVVCRYEFKRNSPLMKMTFKYDFENDKQIVFKDFINVGWYYKNPFDKGACANRTFDLKKGIAVSDEKSITLQNDKFIAQLSSNGVVCRVPRKKSVIVCSLAVRGDKRASGKGQFVKQAVLKLSKR